MSLRIESFTKKSNSLFPSQLTPIHNPENVKLNIQTQINSSKTPYSNTKNLKVSNLSPAILVSSNKITLKINLSTNPTFNSNSNRNLLNIHNLLPMNSFHQMALKKLPMNVANPVPTQKTQIIQTNLSLKPIPPILQIINPIIQTNLHNKIPHPLPKAVLTQIKDQSIELYPLNHP